MAHNKRSVTKLVALIMAASVLVAAVITVTVVVLGVPSAPVDEPGELPDLVAIEETAVVRSVVVSDEDVLPLLPLKGAKIHFIPGNRIELGHESIPFRVTIRCGASMGLLWLSGIPSWLDLTKLDSNIDSYYSRWMPAWSFIVDSSVAATSVVPEDGIRTSDTTPLFNWSTIAGEPGAKYYLQVSTSQDFQSPLRVNEKIYDTYYQVTAEQGFAEGEYYWRLMERGKIWVTGMPPWLDLAKYDPEVTKMPTVVSIETGDGTAKIKYIIE